MTDQNNPTKLTEELEWRGFLNQHTYKDISILDKPGITFYWGVDPSADSMTIGHLAPAMMALHFIRHGHRALLLAGGATGLIGDPDGKKQERELKSSDIIQQNVRGLQKQFDKIFADNQYKIVNNIDWFQGMRYLDFLREIGKNASMTQLLDRDFIRQRIGSGGSGISYAEFSYALIQGYDFLHLYRKFGATLQLAGADQWGNSITGVDLIRRLESAEAHVLTTPLIINKQTGVKFGKSEAGAIWLDPEKTSPYQFYQFWLNCDDQASEQLIKIYTMLDRRQIESLIAQHRENPGQRILQRTLAVEVTDLVHGQKRRLGVENVNQVLFGDLAVSSLSEAEVRVLATEIPVSSARSVVEALTQSQLVASAGEARRLIKAGAISLNGQKLTENAMASAPSLVRRGKNRFLLIK